MINLIQPADLVLLQAKAQLLEAFALELRLYRGYVEQFGEHYCTSRLFAPLEAYDRLLDHGFDENV